jgi:F0F1-type ATP synthase assembly protein I
MIVLLLLGFAAGVLNVMRAAADMNADAAFGADAGPAPDEDDD